MRADLNTYTWKRRRQGLRAHAKANNLPCAECGLPIDWTAPPRTRWSFSADHEHEVQHGGDPNGPLRVTHYGCNSRKGNRPNGNAPRSSASREW